MLTAPGIYATSLHSSPAPLPDKYANGSMRPSTQSSSSASPASTSQTPIQTSPTTPSTAPENTSQLLPLTPRPLPKVSDIPAQIPDFDALVAELRRQLGFTSGIDSADVDVENLKEAMRRYISSRKEWGKFALEDPSRNYTRNGVDTLNEKANLLVLVWNPGKGSLIHDHSNAHCVMKILEGELVETQYKFPDPNAPPRPMDKQKVTEYGKDEVTYISDEIGLHRMSNETDKIAISLHLYTPPWAAKYGCYSFNEKTSKQIWTDLSNLYSDKGVLCGKMSSHV
ncbi:RmlC-like cupin domain-containing protein [Myxozyma melibiosi]|uniref:Cysteine dioxygenase n=1 Tax=Myxozyma melibiosi TaxID=54550 RepID=A0ABR1F0F9_9ASCO